MLAEAVHGLADTSNQALLQEKSALRNHFSRTPFGFGRERFFWAFVVSIVLFSLGSMYAVYEGIEKIRHPHEIESLWWALAILLFAMVMEAYAFQTAVKESRLYKGNHSWKSFIRRSRIPELPVVLLEDFALMGLVFAFVCVLIADVLETYLGRTTLSIGILLGLVAIVLAIETKSLLIGEGALPEQSMRIENAIISSPEVSSLIDMNGIWVLKPF